MCGAATLPCRLVVPAADLDNMADSPDGSPYKLQVAVINFLGVVAKAEAQFAKVPAGQAPVISVAGGPQQTFKIAEGVKLTAQLLATSVCAGKKVSFLGVGVWGGIRRYTTGCTASPRSSLTTWTVQDALDFANIGPAGYDTTWYRCIVL